MDSKRKSDFNMAHVFSSFPFGIFICLFFAVIFLVFSDEASESVTKGLSVCAKSIIPSLFPYMVISSMLTKTGAGNILGKIFSYPVKKLFRLPPQSSPAVILGAFCGFPVGAVTAIDLYTSSEISKNEAERLLPICNNTGPAFLVGVIGMLYWNNIAFGWVLYITQIIVSVIIGIISSRKIIPDEYNTSSCDLNNIDNRGNFLSQLASSISSASVNMMTVCGFVIFFSVIIDFIIPVCELISPDGYLGISIVSFLEFSSASKYASFLPYSPLAAAFTAFSVGWAGLSVHSQVISFSMMSKCGFKMTKYYIYKLIQGFICGIVCYIYVYISKIFPSSEALAGSFSFSSYIIYAANITFLSGIVLHWIKKLILKQTINAKY